MMTGKPFYKSRTLQVNTLILVLTWLLNALTGGGVYDVLVSVFALFNVTPDPGIITSVLVTVQVIITAILRAITKEPLTVK